MAASFEITRNDKGEYYFKLVTAEGKTLLRSEGYTAKASAKNGIESVRKNAKAAGRLAVQTAKDGRPYLNLKAANGQIVATSPMFADQAACDAAVAQIHKDVAKAKVSDNA